MNWEKVKRYFGHLWQSLRGDNPFAKVEELKKEYDAVIADIKQKCAAQRDKEVKDLQRLVENLRERVAKAEADVKKADRLLGKMLMAQQMLEKTNTNLEDLACYMELGKAEKLREFAENLEWSNVLTRIVKCHITVLSRRDELEQRQREAAQRAKVQEDNFNLE